MPPESLSTPEAKEAMRERLGLNDPAPLRYVQWLERAVQGDFGYSLTSRKPVTDMIMTRLPNTLLLVGTAMIFSIIVGISTGIVSAVKQYSIIDYLATFFFFLLVVHPRFLFEPVDDLCLRGATQLVPGLWRFFAQSRESRARPYPSFDPAGGGAGLSNWRRH
ncbi:MAG: ABC transporter permease [Thermomicrobiales bacterium]